MRLSELLSAMGEGSRMNAEPPIHDRIRDREISSLEYDSRHVGAGSAFFAIPGEHTDGHLYIQQAIERGAAAVFCERSSAQTSAPTDSSAQTTSSAPSAHPQPVFIEVENCRIALSRASASFFKNPGDELLIIGVTGTDGKSSTVSFLHQLLEDCSIPTGFISTVSIQTGDRTYDNTLRQSTPEAPDIHRFLRRMLEAGKQAAIVEATSHGLSDKTARLYSLSYDGAIFTNIDHEHLDFHGSFEQYFSDKANLFRRLRPVKSSKLRRKNTARSSQIILPQKLPDELPDELPPLAVINGNDGQFSALKKIAEKQGAVTSAFRIAEDSSADGCRSRRAAPRHDAPRQGAVIAEDRHEESDAAEVRADHIRSHADSSSFRISTGEEQSTIRLPIPGKFNIENVLACAAMLRYLFGIPLEKIAAGIEKLQGVKGRMLTISQGQNFTVLVDYAHTPGSFRRLFPMLRAACKKRLIAVFGSAGERDVDKRPIQGDIASRYADILILTDEDPRLENSMIIIDDIARGIKNSDCIVYKIPDRRSAIKKAVNIAEEGDMIVTLGKGHEGSIMRADGKLPWNEEAEVRSAIADALIE